MQKGNNMPWDIDLPAAGTFYHDKDLTKPLFIGMLEMHDNEPRVKVLDKYKAASNYGGGYSELYAQLSSPDSYKKYKNYTFFGCSLDRVNLERAEILIFDSFAVYADMSLKKPKEGQDYNDKDNIDKTFITSEDKYTKISFEIDNFNDWLWENSIKNFEKFGTTWTDKDGNKCYSAKDEDGCYGFNKNIQKLEVPIYYTHKTLDLSENTRMEIHSYPSPPTYVDYSASRFPNLQFLINNRIDIITREPEKIGFFYWMIYRLCEYFTLFGIRKCQIKRIYDWQYLKSSKEFYNNNIPWIIKEKSNSYKNWVPRDEMKFEKIENDLSDSMKLFLDKQDDLRGLIQFITDMNSVYSKAYTDTYLAQQIQMLETYGNMKLKGNYIKNENGAPKPADNVQDIEKTISEIPDDIFDKIFVHNYSGNHSRGWAIFGHENVDKPIIELKNLLRPILSNLRNYIIHPYKNGKQKEIHKIEFLQNYCHAETFGLSRNIGELSSSLKMLLRWLLYREIGLERHFQI